MKFDIKMTIDIDEEDNILPIAEEMYEDVVRELIQDIMYDIDAEIKKIEVKEVDCDLDHKTILSLNKHLKEIVAKSSEMAAFGSVVTMEYEECPKCRKDLR